MKIALMVLGCLLVLIVVLLSVRVSVLVEYSADGVWVQVRGAFLRFTLIPAPEKRKKTKKTAPKKKAETEQSQEKQSDGNPLSKQGGSLSKARSLLPLALETLGDLCKRIQVKYLRVHYTIAGQPDPAKAALQYGGVWVTGGTLCLLLEQYLHIQERDVSAEVDFCSESSALYASAACSLRVGQALVVAMKLCGRYWTWKKQQNHAAQEENTYG